MWWSIVFGALSLLLQWLKAKKDKGEKFSPEDVRQGNRCIARWRDVQTELVAGGCNPEGDADDIVGDAARSREELVENELRRVAKRLPK